MTTIIFTGVYPAITFLFGYWLGKKHGTERVWSAVIASGYGIRFLCRRGNYWYHFPYYTYLIGNKLEIEQWKRQSASSSPLTSSTTSGTSK